MSRQTANRTRKLTTMAMLAAISIVPVSYTHLDVYKRQTQRIACKAKGAGRCAGLQRKWAERMGDGGSGRDSCRRKGGGRLLP